MKKIFIMVCAAIALVSCGGKTAPSAANVVSDTTEDVTAVAAKTANEAADKAVEAVTTALDEQLKAGDAKTLAKTLASAKSAVEKLQSEGKTEEAAAYASKIKEYVDKNKEALTTAAKGDMTVADLVNGIANLPASVQQGAAAAKAAVNADAAKVASDADAAGKAAKQAAETKIKEDAAAVKAHAEAAKKAAEAHAAAKVEEGKQKIRDAANKKVNEALNEVLGK